MNFFGYLLKWTMISVDADEKPVRVFARGVIDKETVARPNIDGDSVRVWINEFPKS
jgi:hypothetical protein